MTTIAETRRLITSFVDARQDPSADALQFMTEDFTFQSPMMRFDDRNAYLESHRAFQRLVRGTRLVSELYGVDEAALLYDLETLTPAGVQRTAEHFRVRDGRVASVDLLFDAAPWRKMFEDQDRAAEKTTTEIEVDLRNRELE